MEVRGGEKGCHKGRKRTWSRVGWWFGASLGTTSANPAVLVGKRKNPFYPTWYLKKEDFITSLQFILISLFFGGVFSKYLWLHICTVKEKKNEKPFFRRKQPLQRNLSHASYSTHVPGGQKWIFACRENTDGSQGDISHTRNYGQHNWTNMLIWVSFHWYS